MGKGLFRRIVDGGSNLAKYGRVRRLDIPSRPLRPQMRAVTEQARELRGNDAAGLMRLLDAHEEEYVEAGHLVFLCFNYYHAGSLEKAAHYAEQLDLTDIAKKERALVANILFEWRALSRMRGGMAPIDLGRVERKRYRADGAIRALYITASSLPEIVSGYTLRGDAIVRSLEQSQMMDLFPVTRPGFPFDRHDTLKGEKGQEGRFAAIETSASYQGDLEDYLAEALPSLERFAQEREIALVHGVSNYRNGVIGLALARRLGLPFVYEIRGLWEETADTKRKGWRDTSRFEFERRFEKFLYRAADGVLCINDAVRVVLEEEPRNNVSILPNCVGADRVREPWARKREGARLRLGYVGSILEYEGLDQLLGAIAVLRDQGLEISLDLYGRGQFVGSLKSLSKSLKLQRQVKFHGVVSPQIVPTLYDQFDLCVFARKPYRVCELVTPLKPVEAMANGVPCLLSDVAPMREIAGEGAALLSKAGDVASLVEQIARFAAMGSEERLALATIANARVRACYTWEAQEVTIANVYRNALEATVPAA